MEKIEEAERERDFSLERMRQVGNLAFHDIDRINLTVWEERERERENEA